MSNMSINRLPYNYILSTNKYFFVNFVCYNDYRLESRTIMKNRIREMREKQGFTQQQLADIFDGRGINVSKDALSKYENNLRNPSELKWQQMANYFGVSTDFLKGKGIRKNEIVDKLIEDIHKRYFDFHNKINFDNGQLRQYVTEYLMYTGQAMVPLSFYPNGGPYKLNPTIKEFWKGCFKQLIEDQDFLSSLEGIQDDKQFQMRILIKLIPIVEKLRSESDIGKFLIQNNQNNQDIVDVIMSKQLSESEEEHNQRIVTALKKQIDFLTEYYNKYKDL